MTTRCKDALLLGIDGGGTKTDAVLCDGEGRVISRFVGGASGDVRTAAERYLAGTLPLEPASFGDHHPHGGTGSGAGA